MTSENIDTNRFNFQSAVENTIPVTSSSEDRNLLLGSSISSSVTSTMNNESSRNNTSTMPGLRFTRDIIIPERARNWRDNLNNVLYEITPLVQQAQSVNNSNILTSWIPNNRQNRSPSTINNDSYVINFDNPAQNNSPNLPNTTYTEDDIRSFNNYHHQHVHHNSEVGESSNNERTENATNRSQNHHHHHSHNHHQHYNQNNTDNGPVTEAFAQIPEARHVLNTLNRYSPYICILLVKSCYDHLDGLLDLFALFILFSHANWVVRQEIAKQHQKRLLHLLRELIYIVLIIGIVVFMLDKKNIFISLIFTSSYSEPFTLRNLIFSVAITDLILKLLTVGIKILITLLPPTMIEYKGRGRIYLMTESVSQLYRALAPIQPWLVYLLDSYTGSEKIMSVLLSAAYMVAKGSDILNRAKFCKRSFVKLLQKVSFGVQPSKEQLQTAGSNCPICHDSYNGAVMLECSHIFCELCVGTWFDREPTCPLCRAKVIDDPKYRDGSTTFFVQLY